MSESKAKTIDFSSENIGRKWFESNEYKKLIPTNDKNWWKRTLKLPKNYKYSDINLKNFKLKPGPKNTNKYYDAYKIISDGLEYFKDWHFMGETKDKNKKGWKVWKNDKRNGIITYWDYLRDSNNKVISDISLCKGEMIVPYSSAVMIGYLLNDDMLMERESKYVKNRSQIKLIGSRALIQYTMLKSIMMSSPRDILNIRWIWIFPNGEVILAEKGIKSCEWIENRNKQNPKMKNAYVRSDVTASFWHIRPINGDTCNVIYYTHYNPGGNVPKWVIDSKTPEKPLCILHAKQEIDKIVKDARIAKPGILQLPKEFLVLLGIIHPKNIKNNDNNDNNDPNDEQKVNN